MTGSAIETVLVIAATLFLLSMLFGK